jgi:hypothetical protein
MLTAVCILPGSRSPVAHRAPLFLPYALHRGAVAVGRSRLNHPRSLSTSEQKTSSRRDVPSHQGRRRHRHRHRHSRRRLQRVCRIRGPCR